MQALEGKASSFSPFRNDGSRVQCSLKEPQGLKKGLSPTWAAEHFSLFCVLSQPWSLEHLSCFFFFNVQIGRPLTRKYFKVYGSIFSASDLFLPRRDHSSPSQLHMAALTLTQREELKTPRKGGEREEVSVSDICFIKHLRL